MDLLLGNDQYTDVLRKIGPQQRTGPIPNLIHRFQSRYKEYNIYIAMVGISSWIHQARAMATTCLQGTPLQFSATMRVAVQC